MKFITRLVILIATTNVPKTLRMVVSALLSFALALFIGGLVIEATGESALNTYKVLVQGAFFGKNAISETLIKASILMLTGLS